MDREENIRAILQCVFSGYKDEIIKIAVKSIMRIEPVETSEEKEERTKQEWGHQN